MDEERRRESWRQEDLSEESAREATRRDVGVSFDPATAGQMETRTGIRQEGGDSPPPRPGTRETSGHTGTPGRDHDDLRAGGLEGGPLGSGDESDAVPAAGLAPGAPVRPFSQEVEGAPDEGGDTRRLASQVDPL